MLQSLEHSPSLLSDRDPAPVEVVNGDGRAVFVLTCEHAGRHVPVALRDLGIPAAEMDRHIAYDIGAEGLARGLSAILDAPLVLQRFSRLVVDCNRPFDAPDCFPAVSDGTKIPANENLTEQERRRRFDAIHQPFHRAITKLLDRRGRRGTHDPGLHPQLHTATHKGNSPALADGRLVEPRPAICAGFHCRLPGRSS